MSASEDFAKKMVEARKSRRISQTELADLMTGAGFPFHQTTVSRIEVGKQDPTVNEAFAIAAALDFEPFHSGQFARGYREGVCAARRALEGMQV